MVDDRRDQVFAMDIQVHLFPRRPLSVVVSAIIIEMRCTFCSAKEMNDRFIPVVLLVEPCDFKLIHAFQFFQIIDKCLFYILLIDFVLQEGIFHILEEGRFVFSELRLYPVFRPQKDFTICLPYPVFAHPFPPVPAAVTFIALGFDLHLGFEPHKTALNEELDGARCLHQTAGELTRRHFDVEKIVGVQIVCIFPLAGWCVI